MIIKTKNSRKTEENKHSRIKIKFSTWNGILELPTFIWCNNNKDTKKKKKNLRFSGTFFLNGKLHQKKLNDFKGKFFLQNE